MDALVYFPLHHLSFQRGTLYVDENNTLVVRTASSSSATHPEAVVASNVFVSAILLRIDDEMSCSLLLGARGRCSGTGNAMRV